ncbi:MAG TPA: response regulator [Anaeromyxobacteraceae bacterium]|nr:response regulator [Anaeromyxobacteraceae bacterium]
MDILVVDDSKAMRAIVIRAVKGVCAEATCREAANGVEALAAVRQAPPDLVLTDWNMPEMSGFDLIKALRSEGHTLKIGMVTSESNPDLKEQALQAGAGFLLHKPFTQDAVRAALKTVLP